MCEQLAEPISLVRGYELLQLVSGLWCSGSDLVLRLLQQVLLFPLPLLCVPPRKALLQALVQEQFQAPAVVVYRSQRIQ